MVGRAQSEIGATFTPELQAFYSVCNGQPSHYDNADAPATFCCLSGMQLLSLEHMLQCKKVALQRNNASDVEPHDNTFIDPDNCDWSEGWIPVLASPLTKYIGFMDTNPQTQHGVPGQIFVVDDSANVSSIVAVGLEDYVNRCHRQLEASRPDGGVCSWWELPGIDPRNGEEIAASCLYG